MDSNLAVPFVVGSFRVLAKIISIPLLVQSKTVDSVVVKLSSYLVAKLSSSLAI